MPHKITPEAKKKRTQKGVFRSLTFQYSFNDQIKKEVVCTSTTTYLMDKMMLQFPEMPQSYFHQDEVQGVILINQVESAYWDNALPPVPLQIKEK